MNHKIMAGPTFLSALQSLYPGGLMQFKQEGGLIAFPPTGDSDVIIVHPEPEALRKIIESTQVKALNIRVVEEMNFSNSHHLKINEEILRMVNRMEQLFTLIGEDFRQLRVTLDVNPVYIAVSINSSKKAIIEQAKRVLEELEDTVRSFIVTPSKCIKVKDTDVVLLSDLLKVETDRKAISYDDITNLKIGLSQIDNVEDFLYRM